MQIICISRGSQSRGADFADKLAAKLGYECVSREYLLEQATRAKIPIGKLETAIIKPHVFSERLALELEHYKALATSILCEKALKNNIIYHGRTGHLLLPGVGHILKVRVVSDPEYRLQYVMQDLGLPRDKARRYIEQIDDDRRRWVRKFYNVEWDVYTLYDLVLNLSQVSVNNAATAACSLAQLPEFQATPASLNALKDLYLAANARLILARHPKTAHANLKVRANDRVVHLTYLSQEIENPEILVEALKGLQDAREIVCTKAATNILWIQESFDGVEHAYSQVLSLANTWDAAVELIKKQPEDRPDEAVAAEAPVARGTETWRDTGIIDEDSETAPAESGDVAKVYENLINDGRAGGKRQVPGSRNKLLAAIDRSVKYRLIIFDNVFLAKGAEARKRLRQEWSNALAESLKTPVVTIDEIVSQYQFGMRQATRMVLYAALTAVILFAVFQFSGDILAFLSREGLTWRVIATACIVAFVPLFAFTYSSVVRLFLKMIKLD
jgi:cytidylate kinase